MKKNTFILQRLAGDPNQTFGFVSGLGYKAHTLEDEARTVKVMSETRIPAGIYKLFINKAETPWTLKTRIAYGPWFKFGIGLAAVPRFSGILIHAGTDQSHTAGCLLFADVCDLSRTINPLSFSRQAIKRFYDMFYAKIDENKESYFIDIRDEITA